jgi:type I site-specific restriction-modification system R (restriction) subunit
MVPGSESGGPSAVSDPLDEKLCQVVGLNQNYVSAAGTLYHIQIEDRGPVLDAVTEALVRRVNLIVYANYGEPNARIIHGRDHDFEDTRSQAHNRFIEEQIKALSQSARGIVEAIKKLVRHYYETKDDKAKQEFAEANSLYPFAFSKAWKELKEEQAGKLSAVPPPPLEAEVAPSPPKLDDAEINYPLDAELREMVIEIERIITDLDQDLELLKVQGGADDILRQTCKKLVKRAQDSISGRDGSDYGARRLTMMRNSLRTTWRQVKSRLGAG